jgi:hypothetical protein
LVAIFVLCTGCSKKPEKTPCERIKDDGLSFFQFPNGDFTVENSLSFKGDTVTFIEISKRNAKPIKGTVKKTSNCDTLFCSFQDGYKDTCIISYGELSCSNKLKKYGNTSSKNSTIHNIIANEIKEDITWSVRGSAGREELIINNTSKSSYEIIVCINGFTCDNKLLNSDSYRYPIAQRIKINSNSNIVFPVNEAATLSGNRFQSNDKVVTEVYIKAVRIYGEEQFESSWEQIWKSKN